MTDLRRRVPTALAYGLVLLCAVALRPEGLLVVALIAAMAQREAAELLGGSARSGTVLILGFWAARALPFWPTWDPLAFIAIGAVVLLFDQKPGSSLPRRALATAAGAVWVGLLVFLVDLGLDGAAGTGADPSWPVWLGVALLPTWAADITAYAVGSVWGRRRLAPAISPGKTWEGTIAGFAAAAATVTLIAVAARLPVPAAIACALLVGPAGLLGDLFESWVKRRAGAKDSGSLLPGHGGFLDRVDSLIAVAPLVAGVAAIAMR